MNSIGLVNLEDAEILLYVRFSDGEVVSPFKDIRSALATADWASKCRFEVAFEPRNLRARDQLIAALPASLGR